ncbi:bacterioferritin [bacterium]|nr:bacterioferritin [bacterium]
MANARGTIIKQLNGILKNELTAINQYFLHSKILSHQGYGKLATKEYEESIDEMKHADRIIARILYLGGLPNLQDLGKLMVGEHVEEMLKADHALEIKAIADLREAIALAEEDRDFVTADMLHEILASEEGHQDWLRQQLDFIANMGMANYLQSAV